MTFAKKYMRAFVVEDEFDEFWALLKRRNPTVQYCMELSWKILGGLTEGNTGGRSASSDGPPVTSQSSPPASSTPAGPSDQRQRYLAAIDRIQSRTDETGKLLPINAAVAEQLVVAAKARGIDLTRPPSASASV
jgi:hypothetical protein